MAGSPRPETHTLGDLVEALDRNSNIVAQNTKVVEENRRTVINAQTEVAALRQDMTIRPTRKELDRKRRRLGWFLAAYTILVIWMHDQHIENCSPGTRLTAESISPGCDVVFPLHGHDTDYPNGLTFVGLALYGVLFGAGWVWVAHPIRKKGSS